MLAPVDVALRDGSTVRIRPVSAADEPALRAFVEGLGSEDRALRYFSAGVSTRAAAAYGSKLDGDHRSLVAVAGDGRTILAHASAIRCGADEAEVAFAVDRRLRGEGIATTMLAHLAQDARARGITTLSAVVLPHNRAMLDVFEQSGLRPALRAMPAEVHVTMPSELGPEAREHFDRRDAEAARAAVSHVLAPRSIAIVGASDRPGSVGGAVLANLVAAGFAGALHVVNPGHDEVGGRPALRSVADAPGPLDLVVIAIPAAQVLDVARECGEHGVRALVVLSDGFGEAGEEGRARQRELVETCRRAGMRLVGPNCLGVLNTDPAVRLDATFAPSHPPPGNVAFLSQSGALGIAVIDAARDLGLGLSSFASVGDKADLSGNDFLAFWHDDPATDVVLLYLESFGNPRKFSRVARLVARDKPVIAVKGGRSAAGAAAAGSHTGALLGTSDATVQALFEQAGVIATETLGEMFDVAALLAHQPPPLGPRVGIVSNGGGLGILCADACAAAGLDVVALGDDTRRALREGTREGAAVGNPIDLLAAAGAGDFEHALRCLDESGEVDVAIALYVPPMISDPVEVAHAIARGAAGVPVAAVMTMADPPVAALGAGPRRVPSYRFPEQAARAVARAARYGAWRARPAEAPPALDAGAGDAAAVLAAALTRGPGWLEPADVDALLAAYGVPRPEQHLAAGPDEAARIAARLGGPVALKAVAPGLVHRTDAGAVRVGLTGEDEVRAQARAMLGRVAAAGFAAAGFLVQAMAPPGVEVLAGVVADPTFGPVVAVAAGGTEAELLGDSAVRLTPLTPAAAGEMVRSLRTFPRLDGYRGAPRCDVAALEDVLVRLAAAADAHPEIAEIECNPVVVGPRGAFAVDARVRVAAPAPRPPEPGLRAA